MSMYRLGKTYKELSVGDFAMQSKTISESDVYNFAGITGDFNPLHVDQIFVKLMGFDKRVAHAGIAPALITPVIATKLPGLGSQIKSMEISFTAPIFLDDTIVAQAEIIEKKGEQGVVVMSLGWINQHKQLVSCGSAVVKPAQSNVTCTDKVST